MYSTTTVLKHKSHFWIAAYAVWNGHIFLDSVCAFQQFAHTSDRCSRQQAPVWLWSASSLENTLTSPTMMYLSSVESSRVYVEFWIVISILWSRNSPSSGVSRLASRSSTCGTGHGANCTEGQGEIWLKTVIIIIYYKALLNTWVWLVNDGTLRPFLNSRLLLWLTDRCYGHYFQP